MGLERSVFAVERRCTSRLLDNLKSRRSSKVSNKLAARNMPWQGAGVGSRYLPVFTPMKLTWPLVFAVLPGVLAACTPSPPVKPVEKPKPPPIVNQAVAEPTTANANAERCSLQNVQQIGALAKEGGFAVGFGTHGGLAVWSSPEGNRVKPLTTAGASAGSGSSISFPKGVHPVEVVPVARGFAILAKRIETAPGPCVGTCGDKPCPEVKPGEPATTCDAPIGYEYFVQLTDLDGKNPSAGRPFHTGMVDIDKILPGDGRAFGVLTKKEIVWIQKRPDGRMDSERLELTAEEMVIPVLGAGPPAILLLGKDGSLELLDERGKHEVEGKFAASPTKPGAAPAPPKAGSPAPAKPSPTAAAPASGAKMLMRGQWGANGRIEIARRLGDTAQYAVVEKMTLRLANESETQTMGASFSGIVDSQWENGKLRRTSWDKRPVGNDIDVHDVDPAANAARARSVWSGKAFIFAHPTNPPHRAETQSLGIVSATCGTTTP